MWSIGATLKFWMELGGHKPGMVGQFYDLDQAIVSGTAAHYHTMCFHALAVFIVELVAMAMALEDNSFAISLVGFGARGEAAHPIAQAHGTALIGYLALGCHQINDWIGSLRIKLGAVGAAKPQNIASKLDDSDLHSQA